MDGHGVGMARVRVSATVDGKALEQVRRIRQGSTDAALLDEALRRLSLLLSSAAVTVAIRPRGMV